MIAACLALAVWAAAPAVSDSLPGSASPALPYQLVVAGGFERLSDDSARPIEPVGLAFDSFGRIHLSDAALRRVVRLNARGAWLGESSSQGGERGTLRRPGSMATAGVLTVAVLDEEQRSIVRYDLQGHAQGSPLDLDAPLESRGEDRARPVALASDASGALYVADADGDRILRFEPGGELSREWGGPGSTGGLLRGVAGVAVGRRGEVFVSERMPGRIVRFDPTGALRTEWQLPDSVAAERLPLAVDDSLRVACADPRGGKVWVFGSRGELLAVRTGLEGISALAFARDGALWIAQRGARRIVRFTLGSRAVPAEP